MLPSASNLKKKVMPRTIFFLIVDQNNFLLIMITRAIFQGCQPQDNPDLEQRQRCFGPRADGAFDHWTHISGCETAELIERNGFWVQRGGPPASRDSLCKKKSLTFVMPYEMSFVMNFTIGEHHLPSGKALKIIRS